jgi:YVTN family beta-propeller protein
VLALPLLALVVLLAAPVPATRIATGRNPCGAAATASALWVANDGSGTLARVDPATNRVTLRLGIGRTACEVAAGFGAVWVTSYGTGSLVRVDLRTKRVRRIHVGDTPFDVVAAAGRVWTTAWRDGTLVAIDPATSRVVRRIAVGPYPTGLLFGNGSLWVGFGRGATSVARVDPASGRLRRVPVGVAAPSHFLAAAGAVWVVNDGDAVVRVDPATDACSERPTSGALSWSPRSRRTARSGCRTRSSTRSSASTRRGRLVDSFAGGDGAYTALRAFGSMWVTSYAGADVWRFPA